jgi:DNA-binding CsgD family transcriptional regulator/tetratricopeptide (TPR) repeat protein
LSALLHRDRELAAAKHTLGRLSSGSPAVVMIEGGRGAGKSTLLQAVLTLGPERAVTLRARCHAAERDFAFGVVRQLLEPIADEDRVPNGTEHDILRGYYLPIRTIATRQPVVIAIDDLQHADSQSARWCSYLARRLDGLPIALVLAVDGGASPADGPVKELRGELSALMYTSQLQVGPLDATDTAELMAGIFGQQPDPLFAAHCHALTCGNPQTLKTIAARLAAAGLTPSAGNQAAVADAARTLADVVLGWVRHSDPLAADVIEQFAVSPTASLDTAAMLLGVGEDVATAARATFRRYGLLTDGLPDQFAHPAMRLAVVDRLSPRALTDMHLRAATLLSRIGASAIAVAEHIMSVGTLGERWAQQILRQAARNAADDGNWHAAGRYLSRLLLELNDKAEVLPVLAELGAVEYHGDIQASVRRLLTVADQPVPEPARSAALAAFAEPAVTLESAAAADRFRHAAAGLADTAGTDRVVQLRLAAQGLLSGRDAGVRSAVRRLREGGDDVAARQLLAVRALSVAGQGRGRDRCVCLARRGIGADPARSTHPQPSTGALAALALAWAGEFGLAADACAHALERARSQRSLPTEALVLLVRAEIAYRRGDLGAAAADLRRARPLCEQTGAGSLGAAAMAMHARVLLARGEDDAIPVGASEFDPKADSHVFIAGAEQEARGMVAASRGDHRQALRLYLDCGRLLTANGLPNPACSAWRSRAVVAMVGLGRVREARTLGDSEVELARTWGVPGPLGRALTAAAATRELPERLEMLRQAVDVLDGTECRLDLARALIRLGRAQLKGGDNRAARTALTSGLELAVSCETQRLADSARQALHAAGGRVAESNGQTVLTASERRVAELVMQGLGNQEVAGQLSISKRTVDTHLGRIYRKLGISGRNRLREALARPLGL